MNPSSQLRYQCFIIYIYNKIVTDRCLYREDMYIRKKKYLFRKHKNLNAAGLEPAPPGNRPGALTTKPCVLAKLRRNLYTLVTLLLSLGSGNL